MQSTQKAAPALDAGAPRTEEPVIASAGTPFSHGYIVFMFFICFAFSYIDRQVVSILVQSLKTSLLLSDTQIGLLQGATFTLCYATAGLFVARLVDRSNRVRLSATCVAIWAVSTAMCGTASSFGELLVWRAGTAIAEAALSPAALSIFSDMFPPRKVTRASGVFMLGPYVGGGVALLGGGVLLGWMDQPAVADWLTGHGLLPWQMVFFVVGLPGLALAALVLATIREPVRRGLQTAQAATEAAPPISEVLRELFVRNRFCLPYFFGYVALILLFYSYAAWFPTLLIRSFGLTASEVGKMTGPVYMLGGMAGVISASLFVGKVNDRDALKKVLRIASVAATLLVPIACAAPLAPVMWMSLALYGLCAYATSIVMALAPVPLQIAIPNRMRGRSVALLVFLTNAISGGLGPFAVGSINEWLGHPKAGLAIALAIVGTSAAAVSALLYFIAVKRVGQAATAGNNQ
ncbi:MFS transporter [Cupriavidus basilensis]|uniref:L-Proline/Glycine betaine transporter ProP n=1 Tax=Cupriavidus basilensis TaxID=68895 RepID=A0A0C4YLS7_9BURK|nr:MFS transporter [Cupriavidus basilensis]AJG23520.1 L-Proline/Glycine betaine transporter ProP [Cupriavidus basilensis]